MGEKLAAKDVSSSYLSILGEFADFTGTGRAFQTFCSAAETSLTILGVSFRLHI